MRIFLQSVIMLMLPVMASAQQVLDRIVVVVNDHVITESDWDHELAFEALAEDRPPSQIQRTRATLEQLVERELLLQQMALLNSRQPTPEEIKAQFDAVRKQLPAAGTGTEEAWQETLGRYGIPEDDFNHRVHEQANVMRFIDVRFRSNARINPVEVENYYRDRFLPEFRASAGEKNPPPLKDVQARIGQILLEQRVNEGLTTFMQSLRAQATIRYLPASGVAPQSGRDGQSVNAPK